MFPAVARERPAQLDWLDVGCGNRAHEVILQQTQRRSEEAASTRRPVLLTMRGRTSATRESNLKLLTLSRCRWNRAALTLQLQVWCLTSCPSHRRAGNGACATGGVVAAYVGTTPKSGVDGLLLGRPDGIGSRCFQNREDSAFRFANRLLWLRCSMKRGYAMFRLRLSISHHISELR